MLCRTLRFVLIALLLRSFGIYANSGDGDRDNGGSGDHNQDDNNEGSRDRNEDAEENYNEAADDDANYQSSNGYSLSFSEMLVMPQACIRWNGGHMIKYALYENTGQRQCHSNSVGTFLISIAHYMHAHFNHQALLYGQDFSLPWDAGYLNCVKLPQTMYSQESIYAKIGCDEHGSGTSLKLALHLYKDKYCSRSYNEDGAHRNGYKINGRWLNNNVSFKPDFYNCQNCTPEQISNSFKRGADNWYDDDYINVQGKKKQYNNGDKGGYYSGYYYRPYNNNENEGDENQEVDDYNYAENGDSNNDENEYYDNNEMGDDANAAEEENYYNGDAQEDGDDDDSEDTDDAYYVSYFAANDDNRVNYYYEYGYGAANDGEGENNNETDADDDADADADDADQAEAEYYNNAESADQNVDENDEGEAYYYEEQKNDDENNAEAQYYAEEAEDDDDNVDDANNAEEVQYYPQGGSDDDAENGQYYAANDGEDANANGEEANDVEEEYYAADDGEGANDVEEQYYAAEEGDDANNGEEKYYAAEEGDDANNGGEQYYSADDGEEQYYAADDGENANNGEDDAQAAQGDDAGNENVEYYADDGGDANDDEAGAVYYANGYYEGDDGKAAENDDEGRKLKVMPVPEALSLYQKRFWNDIKSRKLGQNNGNAANGWNFCQRLHHYGVWCDEECQKITQFHVDQWSDSDLILLVTMCVFVGVMMLLIFAKRVKSYEKAIIYGEDLDAPHPGLPPIAMASLFAVILATIMVMASMKFVNETLMFAVVMCILLFCYMLKLTFFDGSYDKEPQVMHESMSKKLFDTGVV